MSFTRRSFFAFVAGIPTALKAAFSSHRASVAADTAPITPLDNRTYLINVTGLFCHDGTLAEILAHFPGTTAFGWLPMVEDVVSASWQVTFKRSGIFLYRQWEDLLTDNLVDEVWDYSPVGFVRQPDQRALNAFNWGGCASQSETGEEYKIWFRDHYANHRLTMTPKGFPSPDA